MKEQCALLAQAKAHKLFALGMDSLCKAADMENKYYVGGTNGANCKEGFGKGDSMFVYSLGKQPFTFLTSNSKFFSPKTFIEIQKTKQNNKTPAYENLKAKIWKLDPMDCIKTHLA